MREFQERKERGRYKKILFSWPMVIILALLLVFFARATFEVYKKQQSSAANVVQAEAELAKLKARQNLLQSELARLNTNQGVEEEIRSKFGVAKPGEEMIIIVDSEATSTEAATTTPTLWQKIKNFFQ